MCMRKPIHVLYMTPLAIYYIFVFVCIAMNVRENYPFIDGVLNVVRCGDKQNICFHHSKVEINTCRGAKQRIIGLDCDWD